MPSRRQAALWAQCCAVVGSQPFFVETHAPASRQRSLSAQESGATRALDDDSAGATPAPEGLARSALEQPAAENARTEAHVRKSARESARQRGAQGAPRAPRDRGSVLEFVSRRRASTCDLCFRRATLIRNNAQLAAELLGAVTSARRLVPRFVSTTVRVHSQCEDESIDDGALWISLCAQRRNGASRATRACSQPRLQLACSQLRLRRSFALVTGSQVRATSRAALAFVA